MLWAQMQGPMGPQAGAVLGAVIGTLICWGLIGTVVFAVILRAACWLYNKIVGDPRRGVPEPSFGKAMGIAFVTIIVQLGIGFVIGLVAGAGKVNPIVVQGFSMLVAFLVTSALITAMLPTEFTKGILVALLAFVVYIVVVVVLVVFFLVVIGGGMMAGFR